MLSNSALVSTPPLATAATSHGRTARIVGVLLVTATVASLADSALLAPVLSGNDYLAAVHESPGRVLWGALLIMVAAFTSAGVAIALYPVLRDHARALALGAVGMRILEAGMYLVSALGPILLVVLGDQAADAAAPGPYDASLGALLNALRDQAGIIGALAAYLGAGMYYLVFHQTRLVPRWLADWGLLGVALGFVAAVLVVLEVTTFGSPLMVTMNVPFAIQEMVLAVWLLVRGLAPTDLAA
jgi:hypothetical protein